MFSDRLDVDVFHQPAEGAGLITPGLVADGGEDLVDGGLFEVGHVREGRNDFVCGHDSDPGAVFVDGDVTLEEIANDDGVRIDGLLLGLLMFCTPLRTASSCSFLLMFRLI